MANYETSNLVDPGGNMVTTPRYLDLPNELITQILSHLADRATLYRCLFVTKQFHPIATSFLWSNLDFRKSTTCDQFFGSLTNVSPQRRTTLCLYVKRLYLNTCHWDYSDQLFHVPLGPPDILQRTRFTYNMIPHLARYCQHLTTLAIYALDVWEECFMALGQYCRQLVDLDWYVEEGQDPAWLQLLSCPLQRLRLVSFEVDLDDKAIGVIHGFDQLRCLELEQNTPAPLTHILDGSPWPLLTRLCMPLCSTIAEPTWAHFLATHPHLEHLDLGMLITWTPNTLPPLPRLTHLDLHGNHIITSNDLRHYLQQSLSLTLVKISNCDRIHPADFPEATNLYGNLSLDKKAIESIKHAAVKPL